MNKQSLRQSMKQMRSLISNRKEQARAVCLQILESPYYQECEQLLVYLAIGTELSLSLLIQTAWQDGKAVAAPRIQAPHKMAFYELYQDTVLEEGPYHTLQPPKGNEIAVDSESHCLLIAPGLAFDALGYRLGYGGGYYDNYLRETTITAVGAAFTQQILHEVPHEEHDCRLQKIITPGGSYDCLCGRYIEAD